jgi:phosphoribosylformylglycinamidine synthase I
MGEQQIKALVLTGYGLNCDLETAYALEQAGAQADRVHINAIIDRSVSLDGYHILVFGGGFSWGDDHGAGVVQAVRMKNNIGDRLLAFIDAGRLVIGICNGFQTLVNLGLLPGFDANYDERAVALTANDCGNFRNDWVTLVADPQSPCIFTRGIAQIELPIRHGEGKLFADGAVIDRLVEQHQAVLRYALPDGTPAAGAFPHNPNGSLADIAGICDPTGRIFGLMPHPEAFTHPANHPQWTRWKELDRRGMAPPAPRLGTEIFKNAVAYFA